MSKLLKLFLAATLSFVSFSANADYTFTALGTLGGYLSYATGINASGQVIGSSQITTSDSSFHAALWNGSSATDLGSLGQNISYANGLNDSGQVVGEAPTTSGTHAFSYTANSMQDIGTLGGSTSLAYAINNSGQIVGCSTTSSGPCHAFLYSGGNMQDLGTLGAGASRATGINNSGQIVGYSNFDLYINQEHAFIYSAGSMQDLGTPVGSSSQAWDINDSGQTVGFVLQNGGYNAFLYSGGTMQRLYGNNGNTTAYGINNAGLVVGTSWSPYGGSSNRPYAILWDTNGTGTDLNTLLDAETIAAGWRLDEATAINDNGSIVGKASNSLLGITSQAFLLSTVAAVPELNTNVMLLIGLGLFGFIARRCKAQSKNSTLTMLLII